MRARYSAAAVGLFLVWSNSFVTASFLLGGERAPARFDWVGLSVARFALVTPLCLLYCLVLRRQESRALWLRFPLRLSMAGLLAVPGYNLALFYGQQHGVPPPVASLTTALLPLFVMLLATLFLGERLTQRRLVAFSLALVGLVTIAASKGGVGSVAGYGMVLAVTALAPLSWALYSILTKPATAGVSPLTWTYLTIGIGGLPFLVALPWLGGREMLALTGPGWLALLYLSVLCTLLGYAVWSWLLHHLPAATVGFTVFLNPPLTTVSKLALSLLFPAAFVWQISGLEVLGGGLALAGLALAMWPRQARARRAPPSLL